MLFDLTNELVRFLLRHLSPSHHILDEIARTLDNEAAQSGGSIHDIFHGSSHLASSFQTYLMRLCRHLGDSILDVGATVAGTSFWRHRWSALGSGGGHWRFLVLSHQTLLIYFSVGVIL
jgi:hypothetical protein